MEAGPTCGTCSAALEPRTLDVEGSGEAARVRVLGLPVLACPDDHERREVRHQYAVDLVEALFARGTLPVVVETGFLWFRSLACAACGRDLLDVEEEEHPVGAELSLEVPGESLRVEVVGASLTCPDCGLTQIRGGRERGAAVLEALVDALAGASVRRH